MFPKKGTLLAVCVLHLLQIDIRPRGVWYLITRVTRVCYLITRVVRWYFILSPVCYGVLSSHPCDAVMCYIITRVIQYDYELRPRGQGRKKNFVRGIQKKVERRSTYRHQFTVSNTQVCKIRERFGPGVKPFSVVLLCGTYRK